MVKKDNPDKPLRWYHPLFVLQSALLVGYWFWRYGEGDYDVFNSLQGRNEFGGLSGPLPLDRFFLLYTLTAVALMMVEWLVVGHLISMRLGVDSKEGLRQGSLTFLPFVILVYFPLAVALGLAPTLISIFLLMLTTSFCLSLQVMLLRPNFDLLRKGLAITLVVAVVGVAVIFIWMNLAAYHNLRLGYTDSGIFAEILTNTLRGRFFHSNSLDPNNAPSGCYFGLHFSPILFLLLPIYALFEYHETLLVLQPLFLAAAALPIYFLARRVIGKQFLAFALSLAYLLCAPLSHVNWGNSYGFHLWSLFPLLIACQFCCLAARKWVLFGVFALLTMMTKEIGCLIVVMMGVFILIKHKKSPTLRSFSGGVWRLGIGTSLAGMVWFLVAITLLVPAFGGGGRVISRYHSHLGSNPFEMARNLVPMTLKALVDYPRIIYLLHILIPFALLSLLALPTLLVGGLAFSGIILARDVSKYSIALGHQAALIPVAVAAAAYGMKRLLASHRWRSILTLGLAGADEPGAAVFLSVAVLISSMLSSYFFGVLPWSHHFPARNFVRTARAHVLDEVKKMVPRQDSVAATHRLAAHFTGHRELHFFPWKGAPRNYLLTDWVLIDFQDDWADMEQFRAIAEELHRDPDYQVRFEREGFLVFKKLREPPEERSEARG